ncbi:MAG TPA: hypothetical protein PLJ60_18830 [Chryseolinea sp.]|nr:hypothetical protein [Chryseolinea sp.]HPM32397.1 hypothetical protein [Chryseolinea sp.]
MFLCSPSSIWTLVAIVLMFQCRAVDSNEKQEKELQKLITKTIGTAYDSILNESKSFILCVQNVPENKIGTMYTNFLVIDLKTNIIVERGKYLHGHCKWINDSAIEVIDMPGTIKENQSSSDFRRVIVINQPKNQTL